MSFLVHSQGSLRAQRGASLAEIGRARSSASSNDRPFSGRIATGGGLLNDSKGLWFGDIMGLTVIPLLFSMSVFDLDNELQ